MERPMLACFMVPEIGIACEYMRQPRLRDRPIALVDSHGIIVVASRAMGVRAGQRASRAKALCPSLTVLPYDNLAYEQFAKWVWEQIANEARSVQPISAEQCFATFAGHNCAKQMYALARSISDHLGTPVQVGMGTSFCAAEQAARRIAEVASAQSALSLVPYGSTARTSLGTCLNEDCVHSNRKGFHLKTLGDLMEPMAHPMTMRDVPVRIGPSAPDTAPIDLDRTEEVSEAVEETVDFDQGISEAPLLDAAVRVCASRLSRRLMAALASCSALALELSFEADAAMQSCHPLKAPTCRTVELYHGAMRLLGKFKIRNPVTAVRLVAAELVKDAGN